MKKFSLFIFIIFLGVSCQSNLENLNENQKDPNDVPGASLFTHAEKELADLLISPNVNRNNLRLWVQHWQETTIPDESRYIQKTRGIPDDHWRTMYQKILVNLMDAEELIENTDDEITNNLKANKLAIMEILSVFAYSNLVDTFGDIPYSESLDRDNTLPKYDDAQTVYESLIKRLDKALDSMDSSGSFEAESDLIYGGNVENWQKFGNTLKLKLGMVLADVNESLSVSTVNSALSSGIFEDNEDNATYKYSGDVPNDYPVYDELVLSGRNDFVAASTIVDIMNDFKDPRRSVYFDPNIHDNLGEVIEVDELGEGILKVTFNTSFEDDLIIGNSVYRNDDSESPTLMGWITESSSKSLEVKVTNDKPVAGEKLIMAKYAGGTPGVIPSPYADNSHANRSLVNPAKSGVILSYVEAAFLLAEAAVRADQEGAGYKVEGDPEQLYKKAIQASFDEWEISDLFEDYYANPKVDFNEAMSNSESSPAWKQVIGTQAWLGLYNRTFAAYLSVRRIDYPILSKPERAVSGFPKRYTYPVSESNLNPDNYQDATDNIGGDNAETPIFWDVIDGQDEIWNW